METLVIIIKVVKFIALYIMPIGAFIISIIALVKSNKSIEVKIQLDAMEQKLKEYELKLKEHEIKKIEEENKKEAKIEARIIRITKGKHRIKVWNSGTDVAYNIRFEIPDKYKIITIDDKLPYEYLSPGNGFEELVIFHSGSASKFNIICTWEDKDGNKYENTVLTSI